VQKWGQQPVSERPVEFTDYDSTTLSYAYDENGNDTGWSKAGTWSAADGYMRNSQSAGSSWFYRSRSEGDGEIRFSYLSEDTSSGNYYLEADLRCTASGKVAVVFTPTAVQLREYAGEVWYTRGETSLTTQQNQWYDVIVKLDGTSVGIERRPKGGAYEEVLSGTVQLTATTLLQFHVPANAVFRVDDIMVIDGPMQSTYTMTYNNANELTQMANSTQGTTVAFTYDAWGRTATQTVGSRSATYAYKYGSKLASVTSTLFGEQNVAFEYGGDQKRRSMTTGGVTTQYNWDMGWNVINEETGAGALARSYTHNPQSGGRATLGHVDGTNPAAGAYRYYLHDHLGSTRFVFDEEVDDEVDLIATYQYTPYGDILSSNNPNTTTHLYTGHDWNPATNLYFAPHRYYTPQTSRWFSRDPLGMANGPNLYGYSRTPVIETDPDGTSLATLIFVIGVIGFTIAAVRCAKALGRLERDVDRLKDTGCIQEKDPIDEDIKREETRRKNYGEIYKLDSWKEAKRKCGKLAGGWLRLLGI
jgi:RHS repeat-associated protein